MSEGWYGMEGSCGAYISGSFCVSMTAAMGMPKLLAGPQKSVISEDVSSPYILLSAFAIPVGKCQCRELVAGNRTC